MTTTPTPLGLPELDWSHAPGQVSFTSDKLTLTAAAGVDWTNDATGDELSFQHGATALGFTPPAGDFLLSARVSVPSERTTFDAAAVTLWADEKHWAKICFEWSPQGNPMVVTVVTNDYSDDVNSTDVTGDSVFIRVTRYGPAYAFHSSTDGLIWRFVRLFRLHTDLPVSVGFMSQAPMGESCVAEFTEIAYRRESLHDLRSGD